MAPLRQKSQSKRTPKKHKKVAVEIGHETDDDRKPGCVYIGHVPHGFYEKQMKQYFSQFGKVMDIRLCRSKKTSNSKGYGFVKFKYSAVAKTVAETCNNYLFLNKLLKCEYKPMSSIHPSTFKVRAKAYNVPKSQQNNSKTDLQIALAAKTTIKKAGKKLDRLKAAGLDVGDLSDIVNVPDVSKLDSVINANIPDKTRKRKPQSTDEPTGNDGDDDDKGTQPSSKRRKTNKATTVDVNDGSKSPRSPKSVSKSNTPRSKSNTPRSKSNTPRSKSNTPRSKSNTPTSVSKRKSVSTPKAGKRKRSV